MSTEPASSAVGPAPVSVQVPTDADAVTVYRVPLTLFDTLIPSDIIATRAFVVNGILDPEKVRSTFDRVAGALPVLNARHVTAEDGKAYFQYTVPATDGHRYGFTSTSLPNVTLSSLSILPRHDLASGQDKPTTNQPVLVVGLSPSARSHFLPPTGLPDQKSILSGQISPFHIHLTRLEHEGVTLLGISGWHKFMDGGGRYQVMQMWKKVIAGEELTSAGSKGIEVEFEGEFEVREGEGDRKVVFDDPFNHLYPPEAPQARHPRSDGLSPSSPPKVTINERGDTEIQIIPSPSPGPPITEFPPIPQGWSLFSLYQIIVLAARFIYQLVRHPKVEPKTIFIPNAFVQDLKREAMREIQGSGREDESSFVSSGDVVASWITKALASTYPTSSGSQKLQLIMTANIRSQVSRQSKILSSRIIPYLHNAILTIPSPAMSVDELNKLSVGAVAFELRQCLKDKLPKRDQSGDLAKLGTLTGGSKESNQPIQTPTDAFIRWRSFVQWSKRKPPTTRSLLDRIMGWKGFPIFIDHPKNDFIIISNTSSFSVYDMDFSNLLSPSPASSSVQHPLIADQPAGGVLRYEVFSHSTASPLDGFVVDAGVGGVQVSSVLRTEKWSKGTFGKLGRVERG